MQSSFSFEEEIMWLELLFMSFILHVYQWRFRFSPGKRQRKGLVSASCTFLQHGSFYSWGSRRLGMRTCEVEGLSMVWRVLTRQQFLTSSYVMEAGMRLWPRERQRASNLCSGVETAPAGNDRFALDFSKTICAQVLGGGRGAARWGCNAALPVGPRLHSLNVLVEERNRRSNPCWRRTG